MSGTANWLHCPVPLDAPRHRLVCLPHAGGAASFFREWGEHLPGIEVHAVRYPGRAERIDDPIPTDLVRLASEISHAVEPLADRPIALFGHSLGAAVALETVRSLEARGIPVTHLFASGSRNGPLPVRSGVPPSTDDPGKVRHLIELGGTDPELAADPAFQELVLPYVRGDGRMFHAYAQGFSDEPVLCCPVTTIVGDSDPDADRRPWRRLTSGGFREQVVPGDHFYLTDDPPYGMVLDQLAAHERRRARLPGEM